MASIIFFGLLAGITEFWILKYPKKGKIVVSDVVYIASFIMFKPLQIIYIFFLGNICKFIYQRNLREINILTIASKIIAAIVASFVFFILKKESIIFNLPIVLLATLAYILIPSLLNYFHEYITRKTSDLYFDIGSLLFTLKLNLAFLAPLGLLISILYQIKPYILVLLILPMWVVYRSIKNYTELLAASKCTIEALATVVDKRNENTVYHSPEVAHWSKLIARKIGLSKENIELIEAAAMIHDLGKISISDEILQKSPPLKPQELKKIKEHPIVGAEIAQHLSLYEQESLLIKHHHERYDGSGYPDGLKGEEIPLGSRIIAIADAYQAMLSPRPYRKKLSPEEAMNELINGKETQFDPQLVEAFLEIIREERSRASDES